MLLQRFIRNDATRADPPEIYNLRTVLISLVVSDGQPLLNLARAILISIGMWRRTTLWHGHGNNWGCAHNGAIQRVSPRALYTCDVTYSLVHRQYGLNNKPATSLANLESNIVSVIQAGAFSGCFFSIWLANRIGRRMSLILASVLVFIGVALQAAASGFIASIYVGRFVAGVAIGVASTVNPLYVSENAPRGIRGLLTGFYQLSIVTGLTVRYLVLLCTGRADLGSLPFGSTMGALCMSRAMPSTLSHCLCKLSQQWCSSWV